MLLNELLGIDDVPAIVVGGLTSDSKRVRPGDLFIAYKGLRFDGHEYVDEAISRGAVAICAENSAPNDCRVPWIRVKDVSQRRGEFASRFFQRPASNMSLIGVTGTNGKTSVAYGTASLLGTTACVGTLGWGIPPTLCASPLTTLDPIAMQECLANLKKQRIDRAVLELSSHALDQGRIDELDIECAVFTNLTRDHLDYHKSLEHYREAKLKLFQRDELQHAVVNVDDSTGRQIVEILDERRIPYFTYGSDQHADLRWSDIEFHATGLSGVWTSPWGTTPFSLPYFGSAYVENAAAMLLVGLYFELKLSDLVERMRALPSIPGRMEFVRKEKCPTTVIDYAHTPDALRTTLSAIRQHHSGNVICVFGCGGDRDEGKRPQMAQIAGELANTVVVTSDNPRSEPPQQIVEDILSGFDDQNRALVEIDRTKAIQLAISLATSEDTVVVAGKGHERYQEIQGIRIPYSDRETLRNLLENVA